MPMSIREGMLMDYAIVRNVKHLAIKSISARLVD